MKTLNFGIRILADLADLADLAGGHADATFDKRLAGHVKAGLLILDDFAMHEFTPPKSTTSTS